MKNKYDLVLKNSIVIDGTGAPRVPADIGISDGRIASLDNDIDISCAEKVIDLKGSTVSPGFIDTHTHDDLYLLKHPLGDQKVMQGVTTVVIGNCGASFGPVSDEHRSSLKGLFRALGGSYLPEDYLDFCRFDEGLDRFEKKGLGINVLSLVGHISIRIAVMGMENRAPTSGELSRMKELTAEAMEAGAAGLSTGLIYAPGNYARTEEIIVLASTAAAFGGLYATHLRSEGDYLIPSIMEALEIGEKAGMPVHVSHLKALGKQNWGTSRKALQLMADARADGMAVSYDQYPYKNGSTILAATLPPGVLSLGDELFSRKLKDPQFKRDVIKNIEEAQGDGWDNYIKGAGFDGIYVSRVKKHQHYMGRSIGEIARSENRNPYDVLFDLLMKEQYDAIALYSVMGEDDIVEIMKAPHTMIGSDGFPGFEDEKIHPRQLGTFPRILGRYVRERQLLTMEEAVRKMTSLPARTFGLGRKGVLKKGFDADLVVFDPEKIIDCATYQDPYQPPKGISRVLVNGQIVVEEGRVCGVSAGKVLRHGKNA